ncbi:MAG: sigma-70 family RNA polymerase sigma factor [Lentisphaeraceae bacterium]|nr:sigma-70 family RNA polymerase sigma factor [Lentisphaeraceae bacterium]
MSAKINSELFMDIHSQQIDIDEAVERIRQGDENAFSTIIQAYHVQVRALIGAQIADKHNADDIAQQTFVFAFQKLDDYQIGTNFLAWLRAIARNKVLTHIRKCSQSNKKLQSFRKQNIYNLSSELFEQGMVEQRLEALGDCIENLTHEKQDFLQKVNGRNSTLAELADHLGRSSTAVRKQASRVYSILRDCITKKLRAVIN